MARARRRSGRLNAANGTPEPSDEQPPNGSQQTQPEEENETAATTTTQPDEEVTVKKQEDDKCPACSPDTPPVDTESWVRCDACKRWFHWRCAGKGELEAIDKWFCRPCLDEDTKRVITMKPPARKSSRKRAQRDYAGLNVGQETDPLRWTRILETREIKPHNFKRMKGSEITLDWIEHDPDAFKEPIFIESPEGLGMKMPDSSFSPQDVADILGDDTPVEVIDVATQANAPGWTLGKWAEYFKKGPEARDRIRNIISLEVSGTDLADKILPPRLVREMDWVEKFWPSSKKGRGHQFPKVQLYCLMGVTNAWTDWHIDFAGSSVYYHIVFYFIRPTPANLAAYERWSGTEMQNHSWLGDMCDEVYKVELTQGNTLIIPTGWIHAVYTPVDTLVFGGNYLHSYNVATQLRVREIEINTHVPKRFRYPHFTKLCWYAAEKYLRDLKAKEEFSPRVLESVEALADFLVSESRTMEKGADPAKRESREQVPGDKIKDGPALARELRWRVRLAEGYASDEDSHTRSLKKRKGLSSNGDAASTSGAGSKRKRISEEHDDSRTAMFRNFQPKGWDVIEDKAGQKEEKTIRKRKVDDSGEDWKHAWSQETVDADDEAEEEATVTSTRSVLIKVRRSGKGIERHRVERVLEDWTWPATSGDSTDVKMKDEDSPPVNGYANGTAAADIDVQPNGTAEGEASNAMDVEVNGQAD
ncbi:JmjC domain-containing histone demethylation protein 1 [Steccherinum ochraceum]|uniref:JmjC domain-containing histone demethylation protein 1 n=1 Tax=Steccherinum ochraceum TaxID=92696 RepID=A0A4R0RKJ3_9APHY|nr:JmjC domain-containing histone demethylation protein 1 [Steccherinum ochraceum]